MATLDTVRHVADGNGVRIDRVTICRARRWDGRYSHRICVALAEVISGHVERRPPPVAAVDVHLVAVGEVGRAIHICGGPRRAVQCLLHRPDLATGSRRPIQSRI